MRAPLQALALWVSGLTGRLQNESLEHGERLWTQPSLHLHICHPPASASDGSPSLFPSDALLAAGLSFLICVSGTTGNGLEMLLAIRTARGTG